MAELLAAVAVFIVSHLLPMRPRWRSQLEARLGVVGFLVAYSLLSLVIITWLGIAFVNAPFIMLWPWSLWASAVPMVVMPLVCVLLVAGVTSPNPFQPGLGARGYDPARPGIVSITRQPIMWAMALWAGSHILPNGDLAAVLMFGLLLALSLGGTFTIERARCRRFSPEQWQGWLRGTANLPFAGAVAVDWRGIGVWRLLLGLVLYLALLLLHGPVIGVVPPLWAMCC